MDVRGHQRLAAVLTIALMLAIGSGLFCVGWVASHPVVVAPVVVADPNVLQGRDRRCAATGAVTSATWAQVEAGVVVGLVEVPIYVTRSMPPIADGTVEVVFASMPTVEHQVLTISALGVPDELQHGGHAALTLAASIIRNERGELYACWMDPTR